MSGNLLVHDIICVCDCMCVCVSVRERGREIVSKKNICMVLVISEKKTCIYLAECNGNTVGVTRNYYGSWVCWTPRVLKIYRHVCTLLFPPLRYIAIPPLSLIYSLYFTSYRKVPRRTRNRRHFYPLVLLS